MHIFYVISQVINYWITKPSIFQRNNLLLEQRAITLETQVRDQTLHVKSDRYVFRWFLPVYVPLMCSVSECKLSGSSDIRVLNWAMIITPPQINDKIKQGLSENYLRIICRILKQWELSRNTASSWYNGRFGVVYTSSLLQTSFFRVSLQVTELPTSFSKNSSFFANQGLGSDNHNWPWLNTKSIIANVFLKTTATKNVQHEE